MPSFILTSHLVESHFVTTLGQFRNYPRNHGILCWKPSKILKFPVHDECCSAKSRNELSRVTAFCSEDMSKGFERNSCKETVPALRVIEYREDVRSPHLPAVVDAPEMNFGVQVSTLLALVACLTSIAFTSLVIVAVPTLCAIRKAATSLSRLADTASEELPSTMTAIKLSGMEISDLTLELNDLSQEITAGFSRSIEAVRAAESGIRRIGTLARERAISIIQERANLPPVSLQEVVAGVTRKTSHAMDHAWKRLMDVMTPDTEF